MKSSALAVRWKWRCRWKVKIVIAYVLCFWRIVGIERSIPQGLKPLFLMPLERAKPKGLAYLEAKAEPI